MTTSQKSPIKSPLPSPISSSAAPIHHHKEAAGREDRLFTPPPKHSHTKAAKLEKPGRKEGGRERFWYREIPPPAVSFGPEEAEREGGSNDDCYLGLEKGRKDHLLLCGGRRCTQHQM